MARKDTAQAVPKLLSLAPSPVLDGCPCAGCEGLRARYEGDRGLLAFYGANLLLRGWAGRMDAVERAYVVSHAAWARRTAGADALRRARGSLDVSPSAGGSAADDSKVILGRTHVLKAA